MVVPLRSIEKNVYTQKNSKDKKELLEIADNDKEIFERFYRVDKSHSKEIGGPGLGLSIVRHGVAYHDGEVSLQSTEGVGTKVTVTLKKDNSNLH